MIAEDSGNWEVYEIGRNRAIYNEMFCMISGELKVRQNIFFAQFFIKASLASLLDCLTL